MRNQTVRSKHPVHPGLYEVMSNGNRVWVNGPMGESIARISNLPYPEGTVAIDIHKPHAEVCATGSECLDCRHDLSGRAAWDHFVASLQQNYGVRVNAKHRPTWAV